MLTWPINPSKNIIFMVQLFVWKSDFKVHSVKEVISNSWDFVHAKRSLMKKQKMTNQGLISKNCLKIGLPVSAPNVKNIVRFLDIIGDTKNGCLHLVEDALVKIPDLNIKNKSNCFRTFLRDPHIIRVADNYPRPIQESHL